MASLNAHLNLEIARFLNQFDAAQNRVNQGATALDRRMSRVGESFGDKMVTRATQLVSVYTLLNSATDASRAAMERNAAIQGLSATSAEDLNGQLERLRELSQDPAMEFDAMLRGSTRLQAVGLQAQLSEGLIREMGNALALVGGTDLDGVLLALSQIASKGKVQAEEINQIAERVPQIRSLLSQAFGTADTEEIQRMALTTEQFFAGVLAAAEKLPRAVATEQTALKNLHQEWKDLQVTVGGFFNEFGGPWIASAKTGLEGFQSWIHNTQEVMAEWLEEMRLGKELADSLKAEQGARENDYDRVLRARRAEGVTARDPEMEAAVAEARARAARQIETTEQRLSREADELLRQSARSGAAEGGDPVATLREDLKRLTDRVLAGTGMEGQGRAGLEAMVRGLNTSYGRDRQAVFIEALEEALKIEQQIANLRKAAADEMAGLREQARAGAFRLMSPAEQAQQLREQLGKSLGVDIGSANDLAAGLRALQEEAKAAAASGDAARERSALERLRQAQEDAAALAAMGDRSGEGRGGELSPQNGEGARLINVLFGRSAGDNAAVSEAKAQTTVLRSVERVLREIRDKQGSGESDFFTGLPF